MSVSGSRVSRRDQPGRVRAAFARRGRPAGRRRGSPCGTGAAGRDSRIWPASRTTRRRPGPRRRSRRCARGFSAVARNEATLCGRRSTTRSRRSLPAPRRPSARRGRITRSTRILPHDASAGEPAGRPAVEALDGRGFCAGDCGRRDARRPCSPFGGGLPGLTKDPPFIAAAQGPTKVAAAQRRTGRRAQRPRRFADERQRQAGGRSSSSIPRSSPSILNAQARSR